MSITVGERMMKVETQITEIKSDLKLQAQHQREDFDKVFNKLDLLGGKFAGKWVEKAFISLIILICGSVIVYAVTKGAI